METGIFVCESFTAETLYHSDASDSLYHPDAAMYRYVIRSTAVIVDAWAEAICYWDYTRYKSILFPTLQEMVDNYKGHVERYGLVPNPMFFYNDRYMLNSDDVYYGYDELRCPNIEESDIDTGLAELYSDIEESYIETELIELYDDIVVCDK